MDAEKDTLNIDASRLEDFVTDKTSAIWIPNILNIPDWDIIREVADKYGLLVLEDSAGIGRYSVELQQVTEQTLALLASMVLILIVVVMEAG